MKNQWAKKILAFTLSAVLMLTALTACSGQTPENSPSSEDQQGNQNTSQNNAPKETITLNFWHHYSAQSPENETLTKVLIPKFEQENPGYKINATSYEWAKLHDKILVSANANTLPDVARLDIAWVPEFQKLNILVPLDKEMSDFSPYSSSLLANAMSTAEIGGNYYALALNTNTKILFYNKAALEQAGVSIPKTMDEFAAAAKKLSGKNSNGQQVWGCTEPALAGWNVLPYIWSMGGEITNNDYTKASGYLNGEKTVKAVQMLADLYKNKALIGFNSGDIPMTDGFGTGRYAMLLEGPWKIAELKGAYPDFSYGTADVPAGEGGSHSVLGGEDIGMFSSANKEGAWKFMKFMTSEFAQEEMAKCGLIPVNKEALESATVKDASYAPFLDAIKTAKARPPVAKWTEIDNQLTTAMTSIIKDGADAQKTLDQLASQVDELLK
ncbi:extracellular solute-binding protein [Caproiciproducens sp. LBM24188]